MHNRDPNPYGLNSRPSPPVALAVGLQHLLAMFGGLITAPLLVALGMGLDANETGYLISSALVVSGFATALQVSRIWRIGSGLLSVQGTSFTFIGPLIYIYQTRVGDLGSEAALGLIFGTSAVCALIMMVLSNFIERLRNVLTPNVAGVTIVLLGLTLIWTTLGNLQRSYTDSGNDPLVLFLGVGVFILVLLLSRSSSSWLRMSSVIVGLAVGFVAAVLLGQVDTSVLASAEPYFVPRLLGFTLSVDWVSVLVLLPIFVVSATESVGDLTATASLSGLPVGDRSFWQRIRGGILADSVNSFVAALFGTFPNTTFSQNNGVIRLTGVSSRYVGFYVAGLLVIIGFIPAVAALIQTLPGSVLYGATLLMFIMVLVSGWKVITSRETSRRDHVLVAIALISGLALGQIGPTLTGLPDALRNFISFPVSSGAFVALLLELAIPSPRKGENT